MKKYLSILILALVCLNAGAAGEKWTRVEATDLNFCGKAFDTPNPYHRVDPDKYKGFTKHEVELAHCSAGLMVLFKTNATKIGVSMTFGEYIHKGAYCSYRGADLYIRKDGEWVWAGTTNFNWDHRNPDRVGVLVTDMAEGEKECLMYLPIYSELTSFKVCVPEGSTIESLESPFRHRIVFHGSSFTHGVSTTRAGMSYPMQFQRRTGLYVIPLGFSGRCRMQPYMADMIADVEADAYVFDPFSNPNIPTIRERLEPFVKRMVEAHPGKPLIFQRTIYWERENFNTSAQKEFEGRRALTDSLMPILCKRYPDVYYIKPDAETHNGEASTSDGVHPNDNGYTCWERSIEKPILRILRKYGIK